MLTEDEENTYAVTAMGPLGHVYTAKKLSIEQKKAIGRWLVEERQVPGVLFPVSAGKIFWIYKGGELHLPGDDVSFLPHPPEIRQELIRDLIKLCTQELSGDFVLSGYSPHNAPITFARENGAHAGMGLHEVQGFALLPPKTKLPDESSTYLRAVQLRKAVLDFLDKEKNCGPRRPCGKESPSLRIMTYNIHACVGMDGKTAPRRIARVIDTFDPDIVALQEVDLGRVRSHFHDQAKLIAGILGMHAYFCPTMVWGNEYYGHAILSRFPLEIRRNQTFQCAGNYPRKEARGALWVTAELFGTKLHLINTHLGLGRLERAQQVTELLGDDWLGNIGMEEPVILCGDFNMAPDSFSYRALAQRLHDVQMNAKAHKPLKTFAAFYPFTRIDHIFVSPHFAVEAVKVPLTTITRVASDHLPLIADLNFEPPYPLDKKNLASEQKKQLMSLHRS